MTGTQEQVDGVPIPRQAESDEDIATLAKGGRTNVLGFILRLAARIPFLLVAGRLYGAATLGRFALAVLILEFGAQVATWGLKRGLAEQLAHGKRPPAYIVADALLLTTLASLAVGLLMAIFPEVMFPNSYIHGLDRALPLIVPAIAVADVALAACAYRFDIGATVRARSLVEPWTISIAALGLYFYSARDGLILSYIVSMLAALVVALKPTIGHYGLPRGWRPDFGAMKAIAHMNLPLAAADAIEWGTRRIDLWILGFFTTPEAAGVYYVAQQFASLPQKLKTSFEPILGPVLTRHVAERNHRAIADQVSQVGFWIIAAQLGIALALGVPGRAEMGVVGPQFAAGAVALAFLLAAETTAAPAVVSEAALIYMARGLNLWLSILTIVVQIILTVALIFGARHYGFSEIWIAACAGLGLAIALAIGSEIKTHVLARLLEARISMWRPSLLVAGVVSGLSGGVFLLLPRTMEWAQITFGVPAILLSYAAIIWRFGFGEADRALFRKGAAPGAKEC